MLLEQKFGAKSTPQHFFLFQDVGNRQSRARAAGGTHKVELPNATQYATQNLFHFLQAHPVTVSAQKEQLRANITNSLAATRSRRAIGANRPRTPMGIVA